MLSFLIRRKEMNRWKRIDRLADPEADLNSFGVHTRGAGCCARGV